MVKNQFTTIEFPVFCNYIVHVEKARSMEAALKSHNIHEKPSENCNALSYHPDGESFSYIFLQGNASAGTIAHECWHVVKRIMDYVDAELEDEVVAYHLDYLVDRVTKFLRNKA